MDCIDTIFSGNTFSKTWSVDNANGKPYTFQNRDKIEYALIRDKEIINLKTINIEEPVEFANIYYSPEETEGLNGKYVLEIKLIYSLDEDGYDAQTFQHPILIKKSNI